VLPLQCWVANTKKLQKTQQSIAPIQSRNAAGQLTLLAIEEKPPVAGGFFTGILLIHATA
jgi:hypothetical protein